MEMIDYMGLPDCCRLRSVRAEVVATTAIGPRIIRYGLIGGRNMLAELPGEGTDTPLGQWKPWGGHRLWVAPEAMPRSYVPDNVPVEYEADGDYSIRLRAPLESHSGIEKEITVTIDPLGSGVTVRHRITNRGVWGIEAAPWALTIVRGGGVAILPQEPYAAHGASLLPVRTMALWGYTDLADPRWNIGRRYIRLRTDDALNDPQKIGIANRQRWAAYHCEDVLFVKRFPYHEGARYPDMGCNNEIYTAGSFMEVESLGALERLEPGQSAEHTERWHLFGDVTLGRSEESIATALDPLIAATAEG